MKRANRTEAQRKLVMSNSVELEVNKIIKGIGVSGGICIGQVVVIERLATEVCPKRILKPEEIPEEIKRFEDAVKDAAERLSQIKSHITPDHPLGDHVYILDTHILLLHDRMFYEGTKQAIASERQNAEWALSDIIVKISSAFETIEDEYLRERARDIHFVGERGTSHSDGSAFGKQDPSVAAEFSHGGSRPVTSGHSSDQAGERAGICHRHGR